MILKFAVAVNPPLGGRFMSRHNHVIIACVLTFTLALALPVAAQPMPGPLEVTKTVVSPASGQVQVGELVNFQIIIKNTSRSLSIISLAVNDGFTPGFLEFISAEPAPTTITPGQGTIQWDDLTNILGDLGPGQSCTISVTLRALAANAGVPVGNSVSVSGVDDQQGQHQHPTVSANISIERSCAPDAHEINNDFKDAKTIALNEEYKGYICPVLDNDYFRLPVRAAGKYYVSLYDLPADFDIYIYDSNEQFIGQSLNPGTAPEGFQIISAGADSFYILVRGSETFHFSRPYKLKVTTPDVSGASDDGGSPAPGKMFLFKGKGLPTGMPGAPNIAEIYLDDVLPGNLLGTTPILPGGRMGAGLLLPAVQLGPHSLIMQIKRDNTVIDEISAQVDVQLSPGEARLWIDDAWKRNPNYDLPTVNKLVGNYPNSIGRTIVDVNCQFIPSEFFDGSPIKYRISVEGNKFGSPIAVYKRQGFGGALTSIPFSSESGGVYAAAPGNTGLANQHVVFRFRIPTTLATPDDVSVTGQIRRNTNDTILRNITEARLVRLLRGFDSTIFLNRNTLFRDFDDDDVADLLAELHIHSQTSGLFGVHDRRAAIYCIDSYLSNSNVVNWNNMTVNYSSSFQANSAALAILLLMNEIQLQYQTTQPFYMMIVGNDEQFPFYRMKDPVSDEDGWVTNPSNNPTMLATSNDYYFTDNYYGTLLSNTVPGQWYDGNMELVIGRIIGDGAEDMKNFYLNGIMHNGDRRRVVMASVDGWELGYEPDDNRAGEIDDHLNVPGRFAARGFSVRNDNETPRTIDKMEPYPGDWNTGFVAAANGGMDIFFIGGHNGYDGAGIPGTNFTPSSTPGTYTRFDDDNPITMIVGCHGGLPVPNLGGWGGGAGSSMVYDVIRSGARAYYGASGYSYGSPGNLHACLWGELLLQHNFDVFTQNSSYSSTLGYAVRQGKINYPFGVGNNNGLDKKTVTEFNLFGVPWQRLSYPGQLGTAAAGVDTPPRVKPEIGAGRARERAILMSPRRSIKALGANQYQQTFNIKTASTSVGEVGGFDVVEIPGGEQQYIFDAPLLPGVTPNSIALPEGGQIISVAVDGLTTTPLGTLNIPTVKVDAWTVTGITLTVDTDIDYYYPGRMAELREAGNSHYLLTAFPVRHNPTTNDTVLHDDFNVIVTYEAPQPYGILNFVASEAVYAPGALPAFSADLFNMGDADLGVGGDLAIWNNESHDAVETRTLSLNLAAGGVYPLVTSGQTPLDPGRYGARLRVWEGDGAPAAAVVEFEVKDALLSNLAVAFDVKTGEASFSVDAQNLGLKDGALDLMFAINEVASGLPLDVVVTPGGLLEGGKTLTVPGLWTSDGSTSKTLVVEAVATLDGAPLNSSKAEFTIYTPQGLLDLIINHILDRQRIGSAQRGDADLNTDGMIDSADVILAVEQLNN